MIAQTEEVQDLAGIAMQDFLITSFYLDVNADEFPSPESIQTSLDSAMHAAEAERAKAGENLSHDADESLRADLRRIQQFVEKEFHRENANGLAIFSCSAQDLWHAVSTPDRLQTRIVFAPRPYLAPLATFLSHSKPTAVLLTDRQQARIFLLDGGGIREWTEFEDSVPQRSDQGGWSQMRYQRHSDAWAKHHLDHAAQLVLRLEQRNRFRWLILGTETDVEHDLAEDLHPYVKDRVIGRIHVRIDAPASEVMEAASQVREEAETRLIDNLMKRVQEYSGAGGRGTVGLPATLQALNEQKVHILLTQAGYSRPGGVCEKCGLLVTEQPSTCPGCGGPVTPVENVVDAAIQKALELGAQVEVATQYEELTPIQNMGSILYY